MRCAWILASLSMLAGIAGGTELAFPPDFNRPMQVIGGAGGGIKQDQSGLRHLPIIFIADDQRVHTDWLGAHCPADQPTVYWMFVDHGFSPSELWMLDLVPSEGTHLSSLELRTDNLKEMIFAVLRHTGADQVNILAHGAGAVLAQATLIKYNLFYAVHSAAFIAGPFHGTDACTIERCLQGLPLCCNLTPGSDFLNDVLIPDETPHAPGRGQNASWTTRYLTVRNGRMWGDAWFRTNPESPRLDGALNLAFPELTHDELRCSPDVLARVIPFLTVPAEPFNPDHDRDGDGFQGRHWGGPDCDDSNASIFPGAPEHCEDGVDQDCNAVDISCRPGKDRDVPQHGLMSAGPENPV